jgi:hypothetical protein
MAEQEDSFEKTVEDLGQLYRCDPEAFARRSRLLIQSLIDGFPEGQRSRAYGLQLKIDAELSRYKDPVARMNRMVELFWQGVGDFQEVLTDPGRVLREREKSREGAEPARVLPFKRPLH